MKPEQQKENRIKAMRHFVASGLTMEQSAGIVGNLMVESGMDPCIRQIGGGGGFGLAQWTLESRKIELAKFSVENGVMFDDFECQIDFILHELHSPGFEGALKALTRARNAQDAAIAFCDRFEMPGVPHLQRRIQWAIMTLHEFEEFLEGYCEEII